ncbi:MAG: vWA domain-containing protein [Comamonas sp.]
MSKKKIMATMATAALLAGCGGGDNSNDNNTSPPSQPGGNPPAEFGQSAAAITGLVHCDDYSIAANTLNESDRAICQDGRRKSPTGDAVVLDIAAFDKDGNPLEITGFSEDLGNSGAKIDKAYFLQSVRDLPSSVKGPYSVVLAFDQSGSISNTDPNNTRLSAGSIFLQKNKSPDEMAIGFFQNQDTQYFKVNGGFFSTNPIADGLGGGLAALKDRVGGSTPLYDAVVHSAQLAKERGANENKAVVVFSDGKDTSSRNTMEAAIQSSVSRSVPVYTFALDGADQDLPALQTIAVRTKGAFFYASSTKQLVSMYGSLGNVLRGGGRIYRTHWSLNITPQSTPNCFNEKPTAPGLYTCNVPGNIKITTKEGDIRLRVNYSFGFRVV